MARITGFFVVLATYCSVIHAAKLESYNVDPYSVTASGLSSGGAMAMQFHVAFSQEVHGSGIFAGLPFGCAEGGLTAANLCMYSPGTVVVSNLIAKINSLSSSGDVDNPSNINGDKVFIFHGTKDTTVNPTAARKTEEIYQNFGAELKTVFDIASVHGFPTDFYGAPCGSSSATTQYINNCDYHGAYEALNYLYNGTLTKPSVSETLAELKQFEQGEFGGSALTSMDATGFLYVPTGCADRTKQCKFHISLHGCQQYKQSIGDIYATKTGYLQVAEVNDIIVIFPQAAANIMNGNPNGCWDWWGYLNKNFLTKSGAQMKALHAMLNRAAFCDGNQDCFNEPNPTSTAGISTEAPTTSSGSVSTTTADPTQCHDNEVSFHPFPSDCQYYTMCACGANVLLQCAPGLYFDTSINNCNFIQLVACEGGVRP